MLASLFALLPLLALVSAGPITKRDNGVLISSGRLPGKCLSVEGGRKAVSDGKLTNGTPLVTISCPEASTWDISPGAGSVIVAGTKFALDIGEIPSNNGPLKVWESFPSAPQQTWFLSGDGRLAHVGGSQCVDQTTEGPQTWICSTGNGNQVWSLAGQSDAVPDDGSNHPSSTIPATSKPAQTTVVVSSSFLQPVMQSSAISHSFTVPADAIQYTAVPDDGSNPPPSSTIPATSRPAQTTTA